MRKLTLSQDEFFTHLAKLIASGVTFEAEENDCGYIVITFTGGY